MTSTSRKPARPTIGPSPKYTGWSHTSTSGMRYHRPGRMASSHGTRPSPPSVTARPMSSKSGERTRCALTSSGLAVANGMSSHEQPDQSRMPTAPPGAAATPSAPATRRPPSESASVPRSAAIGGSGKPLARPSEPKTAGTPGRRRRRGQWATLTTRRRNGLRRAVWRIAAARRTKAMSRSSSNAIRAGRSSTASGRGPATPKRHSTSKRPGARSSSVSVAPPARRAKITRDMSAPCTTACTTARMEGTRTRPAMRAGVTRV